MAFCELRYYSKVLRKQTAVNLLLPEAKNATGPFPVLYLLHGLSDDHTIWHRNTSIERYVRDLPLIVAMPDGGRGFYCDAQPGYAYETALVDELIPFVDRTFPTRAERSGRCVGGLSMGGYGAVKFALKYPDRFCAAHSHSGALAFAHDWDLFDPSLAAEFKNIVGDNSQGGPDDLWALADRLDRAHLPALRIDCGTDDHRLPDNRLFHAHLTQLGVAHEYVEFDGAHNWSYWDVHVQEALGFHARALGIADTNQAP